MPNGIIPDESLDIPLVYWLKQPISGVGDWKLILWVNDYVPVAGTTMANLTEATWGGYSRITMTRSLWQSPVISAGCGTIQWGTSPWVYFVTGGPIQTNYGWAMLDEASGKVRWVQRFDPDDLDPIEIGGKFVFWPTITGTSAACAGP